MGYYTQLFASYGIKVGQVLLTVDDVTRRSHYRNAYRTFGRLLELGVLPDRERERHRGHPRDPVRRQRPAGRTGRPPRSRRRAGAAQRRGRALHRKPSLPDAVKITDVRGEDDLAGIDVEPRGTAVGTGGMITKIEAARIATSAGIPTVLTRGDQVGRGLGRRAGRHPLPPDG